ncbi:MAG: ABC transporter ATP-binding protein [Candidatus Delongbacteria bacterium]|nr:ABC transporter ATP-binding protein [Candidatus Delongbacteria bacterium]
MDSVKKLYKIVARYWKLMLAGISTMMIFSVLSGLSVTMAVPLFDYVFGTKHIESKIVKFGQFLDLISESIGNFFSNSSLMTIFSSENGGKLLTDIKEILSLTDPVLLLYMIGFTMIFLIILKSLFYYLNVFIFTTLRGKVTLNLRNMIFNKAMHLNLSTIHKRTIGDLQVRMTSDINIVGELFIKSIFGSLRDITLVIGYVSVAFIINHKLLLYTMIIVPIFSMVISYIGKKIKKYSKRIQEANSLLYSKIEEVFNAIKVVKSFTKEDHEYGKYKIINLKFYKAWLRDRMYNALSVPLSELNGTIIGMIVLVIGGKMVLSNPEGFSFGSFTTFLFAIFSTLHPIKNITNAYSLIKKAKVSLDRVFLIVDMDPEVKDHERSISKSEFNSSIKFENIGFSYNVDKKVLDDVSFELPKGKTFALVGSSGSGKTTLINLIERFYDPTEGSILIDGVNIKDIKIKELHSLFGTVTQESVLFYDTIANNIRYGTNKEISDDDIKNAAEISYAYEFIKDMPQEFNTMLDPKGSNLSGGQKQRLCIARAIVGDPPILVFDEATSALDSESEQKVQKAIEMATKDRTVIIIAHRLSTILNADKIIVMEEGKIIGTGTHDELITSNKKYKLLYDIQFAQ